MKVNFEDMVEERDKHLSREIMLVIVSRHKA